MTLKNPNGNLLLLVHQDTEKCEGGPLSRQVSGLLDVGNRDGLVHVLTGRSSTGVIAGAVKGVAANVANKLQ